MNISHKKLSIVIIASIVSCIGFIFTPSITSETRIIALVITCFFALVNLIHCMFYCDPKKIQDGSWRIAEFTYSKMYRHVIERSFTRLSFLIFLIFLIFVASLNHIDKAWFTVFCFVSVYESFIPLTALLAVSKVNEDEIYVRRKRDGINDLQ